MSKLQEAPDVLYACGRARASTHWFKAFLVLFGVLRWVCGILRKELLEKFDMPAHANCTNCMSMLVVYSNLV